MTPNGSAVAVELFAFQDAQAVEDAMIESAGAIVQENDEIAVIQRFDLKGAEEIDRDVNFDRVGDQRNTRATQHIEIGEIVVVARAVDRPAVNNVAIGK